MNNIFNNSFLEIKEQDIINKIDNTGFFFFESAVKKDYLDQIIFDLSKKKFGLNDNFVAPVRTKTQYYFTNALAVSQNYFNLITAKKFLSLARNKFKDNFRLKCHRYYETMYGHHMTWHADNVDNHGNVHENDGLIFIMYVNDVFDGEFQLIKDTNLKENHNERLLNYSSDKFVEKNFKDKIISFKGKAGSIIIYDTWHLHRAKPIKSKSFTRKSIFMQIDKSMRNSEKIVLTPDFISKEQLNDQDLMRYLGFGEKSDFPSAPIASYKNLPAIELIRLVNKSFVVLVKSFIRKILNKVLTQEQILKLTLKKKK